MFTTLEWIIIAMRCHIRGTLTHYHCSIVHCPRWMDIAALASLAILAASVRLRTLLPAPPAPAWQTPSVWRIEMLTPSLVKSASLVCGH